MSEKPRHYWRIHLSTAVVIMFVASWLLWINMPRVIHRELTTPDEQGRSFLCNREFSGWPWVMLARWNHANPADDALHRFPPQGPEWDFKRLIGNAGVAVLILFAAGFCSECFIRRERALRRGRKR